MYLTEGDRIWQVYLEGAAEDMMKSALIKAQASEDIINFFLQQTDNTGKLLFRSEQQPSLTKMVQWLNSNQATTKQLLDYYKSYQSLKLKTPVSNYDTFRSFEQKIDDIKGKKEYANRHKQTKQVDTNNFGAEDLLVDDDVVSIYKADSESKCVKYGRGYSFCISRPGSGNMYGNYRIHNASAFYFCFLKNIPTSDPKHIAVIDATQDGFQYTFGDNNTKKGTWEEIVGLVPAIAPYKKYFVTNPLTPEEANFLERSQEFSQEPTKEAFYGFTPAEQVDILHCGMDMPDDLFDSLSNEHINEWVSVGPQMNDSIYIKLTPSELKRFATVRKQQILQRGDYGDKFDKLVAESDTVFHKQLTKESKEKCDAVESKIRSQVVNGVFECTDENQHLLYFGKYEDDIWEGVKNPNQLTFFQPDLSDITISGDVSINYDLLMLTEIPKLPKGKYKLSLMGNSITSLKGLPEGITELVVASNKLKNLEGLPRSVTFANIFNNPLTSLKGITPDVKIFSHEFTPKDIENAKHGIFTKKVQENNELYVLLKRHLLKS